MRGLLAIAAELTGLPAIPRPEQHTTTVMNLHHFVDVRYITDQSCFFRSSQSDSNL